MKHFIKLLLVFLILSSARISAQNLSLNDLQTIGNKSNWENVNQYLMNKGWEYYDSENGSSTKYNTIKWTFDKGYEDKATAWFSLYTYEGLPNKINYSVFNKAAYSKIQNSLSSLGYNLVDSEINDSEIISRFSNTKFIIVITTEKREDLGSYGESVTAYRFLLINISGIYDPNNGKKTEYWYDDIVKAEYTLKNGKREGQVKSYHENGILNIQGTYKDGKATGKFVQFDEDGNKSTEFSMLDDQLNGLTINFIENEISEKKVFEKGYLNGNYTGYYYDDDGVLQMKIVGNYTDDKKDGAWYTISIRDNEIDTTEIKNYKDGIRNGRFEEFISADTFEICNYYNDVREGVYSMKIKINGRVEGQDINRSWWSPECEGFYLNGQKSGKWKYYYLGNLSEEGSYIQNKKEGKWTEYVVGGNYMGQIQSETNYQNNLENGIQENFFDINFITDSLSGGHVSHKINNTKIYESYNYVNGSKEGEYVYKDSLQNLRIHGQYLNNLESGIWIMYNEDHSIYCKINNKEGIIQEKSYFENSGIRRKEKFEGGKLKEIEYLDNSNLIGRHIIKRKEENYIVNVIQYTSSDTVYSYTYKINSVEPYTYKIFKDFGSLEGACYMQVGDVRLITGRYSSGWKSGQWLYSYPRLNAFSIKEYESGKLIEEHFYQDPNEELFNGEISIIHPNNLTEQIKIKNGLRHGKTRFYNEQNEETKVVKYKNGIKVE